MSNFAIGIQRTVEAEQRIITEGIGHTHQARFRGDKNWFDVTRIWGDIRRPFRFGKSWKDHVAVNKRRVLHG